MDTRQHVVVFPHEPIGQISPYLHGHFAEHLGELIYPGISVDPDGAIPNTAGLRNDVIAALQPLRIPLVRWPGGCFADTYHWQDGIGPRDQRPRRVNAHWDMASEPNQFGTHEFMAFCQALGATPYFAANIGSGTPAEMRDWVEYCNFAGPSTLAALRRANGSDSPFHVRYWGIGNESWGCGGHMSPEEYAAIFARYRTFLFNYPGTPTEAIACGPNGNDWAWTRRFFAALQNYPPDGGRLSKVQGFSAHYYCGTAGTATDYDEQQWFELLAKAYAIEGIITGHRTLMDEFDPARKIKLVVDEWGTWHPVEQGKPSGGLYQQNTIRDACVAALSLDVFHNHADQLFMANIAQLINVLQALLLVNEQHCIKTPTYHVFDLYQPHKGATAVRFLSEAQVVSDGEAAAQSCQSCYLDNKPFALQAIHGSASIRDNMLCVTVVNTHPTQSIELDLQVSQGSLGAVEVVSLMTNNMHAHNTFEQPDLVRLSPPRVLQAEGNHVCIPLAAGSIARIISPLESV